VRSAKVASSRRINSSYGDAPPGPLLGTLTRQCGGRRITLPIWPT
jgi:hypothetical protein